MVTRDAIKRLAGDVAKLEARIPREPRKLVLIGCPTGDVEAGKAAHLAKHPEDADADWIALVPLTAESAAPGAAHGH